MRKHYIIKSDSSIPLIGVHTFGVIDRGTNLLQVRPISGCPLNCVYCSVDEGVMSRKPNTYQVETSYLIKEFNKIVEYKGVSDVEAHIDGVGEPLLDNNIVELVEGLRRNASVKVISMQTNGVLLKHELIEELKTAGLDRINLSINTLDSELAKKMTGVRFYDVNRIKRRAKKIVESGMKLLIAPVLVQGFNEDSMSDLILFAKELKAMIGIQKYERQKHGRRLKVKEQSWYSFNKQMRELEKNHDYKVLLSKDDFNIHKCKSMPIIFKKGEIVKGRVVLPGWLRNEIIIKVKNRLVTVFNSKDKFGDFVKGRIVKTKHNLYLAEKAVR
jgi:uncharacterized Fe-S cluster-containing radical SAM superfamily enzyme